MKSNQKKILIIDSDNIAIYELFSLFVRQGCQVESSMSIRDAVQRIKDVKFDCVLLDVDMPAMKGYDAVSILKAIDPDLRIIMTSKDNNIDLETEVRKQDIFYYYIKSFDREELVEAVRDAFNKRMKA